MESSYGFLGYQNDLRDSTAVILPVPYDRGTYYRAGTRDGPAAILKASQAVEEYDTEYDIDLRNAIHTCEALENFIDVRAMMSTIATKIESIGKQGKQLVISIGGEHTITYGVIKGMQHLHRTSELSVLQLDAHMDMANKLQGSKLSHGCVMRRLYEDFSVNIAQIGIRSYSKEEVEHFGNNKVYEAVSIKRASSGRKDIQDMMVNILEHLRDKVYISIDLDVFDPSIAPAVTEPVPGGLDYWFVNDLIKLVFRERQVVGVDIVELCPIPNNVVTEMLAVDLVKKVVCSHIKEVNNVCS